MAKFKMAESNMDESKMTKCKRAKFNKIFLTPNHHIFSGQYFGFANKSCPKVLKQLPTIKNLMKKSKSIKEN